MENRTEINSLLGEVGASLGLNLAIRGDGLCVIKYEQTGFEYVLELSSSGDLFHMYSPIGDVPIENKSDALEYLLKLNLYGIEANQCSIGIDAKTNKIVLSCTLPVEILNAPLLANVICNFFTTAPKISKKIENFIQLVPQSPTNQPDGQAPLLTMV